MIDKRALYDDLLKAFVNYQYRLDNPWPSHTETEAIIIEKYRSDPLFSAKVQSMVAGVLHILDNHIDMKDMP